MSTLTRWLGGGPKLVDRGMSEARVAIRLDAPEVMVSEISERPGSASERRSVGLRFEEGDVFVELRLADPEGLIAELTEAVAWKDKRG